MSIANIPTHPGDNVRKSLILRGPQAAGGVNLGSGGALLIQGSVRIVDATKDGYAML